MEWMSMAILCSAQSLSRAARFWSRRNRRAINSFALPRLARAREGLLQPPERVAEIVFAREFKGKPAAACDTRGGVQTRICLRAMQQFVRHRGELEDE